LIVFSGLPLSFAERRRRVLSRLRQQGWRFNEAVRTEVGDFILIARGKLSGNVTLVRRAVGSCGQLSSAIDCLHRPVDNLQVVIGNS
jgi:hypothetical protein